jgi:hypothetical protein
MEGLFFWNRVGVPTISFLDEIRTAVGQTLGGARAQLVSRESGASRAPF